MVFLAQMKEEVQNHFIIYDSYELTSLTFMTTKSCNTSVDSTCTWIVYEFEFAQIHVDYNQFCFISFEGAGVLL